MKSAYILKSVLVGIAGLMLATSCGKKSNDKEEAESVPQIDVSRAETDSVVTYTTIPGILHAVDKVDLVARVSGYLRSVNYKSGDIVRQGQLLFTIEDTSYRDAVAQAQAQLNSARSSYEYASAHYAAMQKAMKSNAVSAMEVRQAKSAVETAQADIANASAALQTAQTQLGYCRVYAPFTGRITASAPSVGAYLNGGAQPVTMATIYRDSKMQAYFNIEDASFLRSFADADSNHLVDYNAIPLHFSETLPHSYTGVLNYMAPDIDPSTGTMQVRADVNNPYGELREGMYVTVSMPTGVEPHAVIVKDAAVSTDQRGKYLYTVGDSGKIVYTPVTLGDMANDSMRVALTGINPGQLYVTRALLKVRPGMKIKPVVTP